jgi:beta-glucosidase
MAWYPGMKGGTALGQLLFGDANFSGKLPITWGANVNQYPTFNGGGTTTMDYDIGYRRFDRMSLTPLFPLGHGLSYTTFQYSNLVVPCSTAKAPTATTTGSVINVQVDVANTGTVVGDEVVLLFVSYPNSTARRPVKELKGFLRVAGIAPGTARPITIPVRVSDLKYYDMASSSWKVETGPVKIMVGPKIDNLPLSDTVMVQ